MNETSQNKSTINKKGLYLLDIAVFVVLIILDQLTKYLSILKLKGQAPFVIMENVFEFHYLENHGSAFGMFENKKIFILLISGAFMLLLLFVLSKVPNDKRLLPVHILISMVLAGGIGNMIDRIRFDYVVDFIYFKLINYPIFNVADIYVVVATICLGILLIFVYKEDELSFLDFKKSKNGENN